MFFRAFFQNFLIKGEGRCHFFIFIFKLIKVIHHHSKAAPSFPRGFPEKTFQPVVRVFNSVYFLFFARPYRFPSLWFYPLDLDPVRPLPVFRQL